MRVQQATYADIQVLGCALGNEDYFTERFDRQKNGDGKLFIAWQNDQAVGDVYLWLERAEEKPIRRHLRGVALLTHLEVLPEFRNRGIGTELINAVETYLWEHGHDRVALAVRTDNENAARLYRGLGYVDWGHGTITCYSESAGDEECHVMVKVLQAPIPSVDSAAASFAE